MLGSERNSERMLGSESERNVHRTSQDWGLWRRSDGAMQEPSHYHKPHYVTRREPQPQLCYSSLDLGLDYRKVSVRRT